jgi:hypothetical protein
VLTVRTPEGAPAVDAEVAPTRPGQPLVLGPAGLGGLLRPSMRRTDADGRVELSLPTDSDDRTANAGPIAPGGETWILITHTTGIGRARWTPSATRLDVQLEAWARVEGRVRTGAATAPLQRCTLSEGPVRPGDARFVMERFEAVVETDGRFAFPRVPPWPVRLACDAGGEGAVPGLPMAPEWEWGLLPAPGQTLQLDTGLEGRRVTLRWRLPDGVEGQVLGAFLAQPGPRPPADLLRQPEAATAWMQRPEVWKALATARQWSLRAAKAGAWQAGSVPPGEYQLQVVLRTESTPGSGALPLYGATVRVPPGNPGDPCDLGEVILEAVSE